MAFKKVTKAGKKPAVKKATAKKKTVKKVTAKKSTKKVAIKKGAVKKTTAKKGGKVVSKSSKTSSAANSQLKGRITVTKGKKAKKK